MYIIHVLEKHNPFFYDDGGSRFLQTSCRANVMDLQAWPLLFYMVNNVLHWNLSKLPFISLPKQGFWLMFAGPVAGDQYLLHSPNHQANRFIPGVEPV